MDIKKSKIVTIILIKENVDKNKGKFLWKKNVSKEF